MSCYDKRTAKTEQGTSDKRAIKQSTSDKARQILQFVADHPYYSSADVAAFVGLSQQRTRHYLTLLVKENKLETKGANRNRVYLLKNQEQKL